MSQFPHIGQHWFAIQTRYRYEQRVAGDLSAKGIENYLPLLHELHQWKDRSRFVDVPAFTGYLFVRIAPAVENRVRVLETAGVVRMLGTNGHPEIVSEPEIASLQLSLMSGHTCSRHPYLAVGSQLRILRGPLAGLEGRLQRNANAFRIVVSVASIGQAISVELSSSDVQLFGAEEAGCFDSPVHVELAHCLQPVSVAAKEDIHVPAVSAIDAGNHRSIAI